MGSQTGGLKLILVDPDLEFARSLISVAADQSIKVDHYKNMSEIGYLGRFADYDVAILNETLEKMTGLEIAEYFEKLLGNMPMILLQSNPQQYERSTFPKSVVSFIDKLAGPEQVLLAAKNANSTKMPIAKPGEQEI